VCAWVVWALPKELQWGATHSPCSLFNYLDKVKATLAHSTVATGREFIARVNAHDPHGLYLLCAPDHVFIDSLGARLTGRGHIEQAWIGYFSLFPDYLIEVEALASRDALALLSGWASATYRGSGRAWRIPCAWRAVVSEGLIAEWQVFADNKPVYEILSDGA
jgi:ketosteroid isomerase-like protein